MLPYFSDSFPFKSQGCSQVYVITGISRLITFTFLICRHEIIIITQADMTPYSQPELTHSLQLTDWLNLS